MTKLLNAQSNSAIFSRVVAAILGAYFLANLVAIAISFIVTGPMAGGVAIGMLSSYLVYGAAIIWVFAAATATQAWLGLASACLISGLLIIGLKWIEL